LLVEPLVAIAVVVAGFIGSLFLQKWGIEHLGWFSYPCNDMRLHPNGIAACMSPTPTDEWALVGAVVALALWLAIRGLWTRARVTKVS
jgi:hypothetical protein